MNRIFKCLFLCIALLTTVFSVISTDKMKGGYEILFLLPLVYGLSILYDNKFNTYFTKSIVYTISIGGGLIRMCIVPLTIVLARGELFYGFYETVISDNELLSWMPYAILLMCFEQIVIIYCLNKYVNRAFIIQSGQKSIHIRKSSVGKLAFLGAFFFMLAFVVLMCLRYSSFLNYFDVIWNKDNIIGEVDLQGSAPSVFFRLFIWFADMLQLLIPIILVSYIRRKRIPDTIKKFFYMIVAALMLCVMTDDKVLSILYAILILWWVKNEYNMTIPKVLYILIGGVLYYGLYSLINKNHIDMTSGFNEWYLISGITTAYFNGPANVAGGLLMNDHFEGWRIHMLINDLLNAIPFVPAFYRDHYTTGVLFNECFKGPDAIPTKIIPLINQGAFYLTYFLAPLIDVFIIKIAFKFENKYLNAHDTGTKLVYMFMTMFISFSPIMYNASISIKNTCNMYVVYWLLNLKNRKKIHR